MTDVGSVTLGVGLGFLSVGIGILSLVVRSECQSVELCWGAVRCTKGTPAIDEARATDIGV